MIVGGNNATIVIQPTGLVNATPSAELTIVIRLMHLATFGIDPQGAR